MSASDPIQHHKQLDDTRSKTDKDVDSPDNDSVFGDSAGSAAEDVFNPPTSLRRINMSNFSSPGSPKVFAASRYETSRIMTSSSVREHRFSSSSSSSSLSGRAHPTGSQSKRLYHLNFHWNSNESVPEKESKTPWYYESSEVNSSFAWDHSYFGSHKYLKQLPILVELNKSFQVSNVLDDIRDK